MLYYGNSTIVTARQQLSDGRAEQCMSTVAVKEVDSNIIRLLVSLLATPVVAPGPARGRAAAPTRAAAAARAPAPAAAPTPRAHGGAPAAAAIAARVHATEVMGESY